MLWYRDNFLILFSLYVGNMVGSLFIKFQVICKFKLIKSFTLIKFLFVENQVLSNLKICTKYFMKRPNRNSKKSDIQVKLWYWILKIYNKSSKFTFATRPLPELFQPLPPPNNNQKPKAKENLGFSKWMKKWSKK